MPVLMIQRCFHSSTRTLRSTTRGQFKLPADPTTTTYRGKVFEWQTLNAFESIGMKLRHIGGRSDGGIDLKGQWTLLLNSTDNNNNIDHEGDNLTTTVTMTSAKDDDNDNDTRQNLLLQQQQQQTHGGGDHTRQNDILLQQPTHGCNDDNRLIPVVVQCKNVKSGCTPDHLRGLLGSTVGLNSERRTLGILASSSPKTFTPDTMALFNASTLPLGLARVTPDSVLNALVLNHTAQQWLDIQILPRFDSFGKPVSPPLIITGNGRVVPSCLPSSSSAAATSTIMTTTTSRTNHFDT